ncbi:YihY/virulence factor BrkB family protein [Arthrobacter sp. CG_A4]|uniref:YihY/virulence factor BrkB family protein n=1 Tax=Arthrobacter sp. CG_A4 TaxID=3071706 RepID=UPI003FA3A67F
MVSNPTTTAAAALTAQTAQQTPAEPPPPSDLAQLKLEVIRKKVDWGKARRSGSGGPAALLAMMPWLLARLNAFRPVRAVQHYGRQHGPLMSAGIGFRMFFSITGLLATGFSLAGLVLRGQPALLERVVSSVATNAPGLLKVDGSEGLVDPQDLLNPSGLGWAAVIAAVVTVVTSLGWIDGLRDGVRAMMQLGPLKINPVLLRLHDAGTLLLLGVTLVISAGASLVFGTAAGWVTEQLSLDPLLAGPLTTSVKIAVPLLLGWATALIMFRLAAGLRLARRALLEGTILAAVGTAVLQVFSAELLANAGRNPLLAPFAIIIGLLIWFNLVSQVYLIAAAWAAIRNEDLKTEPANRTTGWGARQVQPGKTPVESGDRKRPTAAGFRRRGAARSTPK